MFLNLSDLVAILKKAKQSAANNKPATHETATYKTTNAKLICSSKDDARNNIFTSSFA